MTDINTWIDAHAGELIEATARLCRVPSVGAPATPGHPFGDGVAAALDEALAIAREWGLATENHEYYVGTAQLSAGAPRLGVLCHLDTVPVGEGWTHDPFAADICDGRLIARGAIDDKGPAAAALFALYALRGCGVPLAAPCRVVLGGDEETGSTDMAYYQTKEAFPPYLFSPDGEYPVINTEKGRVQLRVTAPMTDDRLLWARGGQALNALPTEAVACLRGVDAAAATQAACGLPVSVTADGDNLLLTARGVAAHGSTPEKGVNAVTTLLAALARLGAGGETIAAAAARFPHGEWDGAHAGVAVADEISGPLTLALTRLTVEDGAFCGEADIRFPVSETVAGVCRRLHGGLDDAFSVSVANCVEGHHVPQDSPFVQKLLAVYERQTGQAGYGLAIGGGTYVHGIENAVAFGAEFPGVDHHMHGADEFIGVDELILNAKLIAHAIAAVCGTEE